MKPLDACRNPNVQGALTPAMRAAHAALSPLYAQLAERAAADPGCWPPEQFNRGDLPSLLDVLTRPQRWPVIVSEGHQQRIGRVAVKLTALLRSVVFDLFGDDMAAAKRWFRTPADYPFEYMFSAPNGLDYCITRVDFALTRDGPRVLEFNMGPGIGGWEVFLFEQLYRSDPHFEWLYRDGDYPLLTYQPIKQLMAHAFRTVRGHFGLSANDPITLGIGVIPSVAATGSEALRSLRDPLRAGHAGGDAHANYDIHCFSAESTIHCTDDEVLIDGKHVHAFLDFTHETSLQERFIKPFKSGSVLLFNAPAPVVLGSKSTVALLSLAAEHLPNEADRALLRHIVPWTRRLEPGTRLAYNTYEGPIREVLLENRESLVLKPDNKRSGLGVVIGARTDERTWQAAVDDALHANDFVAQELCSSDRLLASTDGVVCEHDVVWSAFVFGNEFAGSYARMQPAAVGGGVVNVNRGASEAIIFHHA